MEQIPSNTERSKHFATLISVLVLVAIVAVAPHAFAQQGPSSSGVGQQNGIPLGSTYTSNAPPPSGTIVGEQYNDSNNPTGPLSMAAWAAGMAVAGIMTGVGVYSTVRKH